MHEERCYYNRHSSVIWYKARSNTLQLADTKRFVLGRTECILCGVEVHGGSATFSAGVPWTGRTGESVSVYVNTICGGAGR